MIEVSTPVAYLNLLQTMCHANVSRNSLAALA